VHRRDHDSGFAIPIPTGLDVTTIDFLSEEGDVLHRGTLPRFPASVGAGTSSAEPLTFGTTTGDPLF